MLSFDITDRNIKIISGHEKGGKIQIVSYAMIELAEGIIENGLVKDSYALVSQINKVLKERKMNAMEAVISISSNLIIFKEINVPKARGAKLKTLVETRLDLMVDVTEEQSVGFIIVGDNEIKQDNERTIKILATSCPKRIVDSYKKVFSMLRIILKNISVSCNSISKLIAKDKGMCQIMPMLLVQIDPTFININIFENSRISFSRFATIAPDNYEDRNDYMFHAVYENIDRVLQFQESRSKENVSNVVFYGDTSLFPRLKTELEKYGIEASLLCIDHYISGFGGAEFVNYANAIGAMFKGNKQVDLTNLIELDFRTTKQSDVSVSTLAAQMGGSILVGAIIIAITFVVFRAVNNTAVVAISNISSYENSYDTVLNVNEYNTIKNNIAKLTEYRTNLVTVTDCINSQPVIRSEIFNQIREAFDDASIQVNSVEYNKGTFCENYVVSDSTIPAKMATNIINGENNFCEINYAGYEADASVNGYRVNFSIEIRGDLDLGRTSRIITDNND